MRGEVVEGHAQLLGPDIEIGAALLQVRPRLRVGGNRRPLHVERGVERRHPGIAHQVGIGPVLEQIGGDVEVAVDEGHEQRRGLTVQRGFAAPGPGKALDIGESGARESEPEQGEE